MLFDQVAAVAAAAAMSEGHGASGYPAEWWRWPWQCLLFSVVLSSLARRLCCLSAGGMRCLWVLCVGVLSMPTLCAVTGRLTYKAERACDAFLIAINHLGRRFCMLHRGDVWGEPILLEWVLKGDTLQAFSFFVFTLLFAPPVMRRALLRPGSRAQNAAQHCVGPAAKLSSCVAQLC